MAVRIDGIPFAIREPKPPTLGSRQSGMDTSLITSGRSLAMHDEALKNAKTINRGRVLLIRGNVHASPSCLSQRR